MSQNEEQEKVSIATLTEGAAVELFDEALQEAWDNIVDPNTDAVRQRTVTLKVTLKPDKERDLVAVDMMVGANLAPNRQASGRVSLGITRANRAVAAEIRPKQMDLYDTDNVTKIGGDK
jgi:hypothetical protein